MNLRRILNLAAALAAVAAATGVVVVAASFAVYALAEPYLGPAGAAAVVAGVFALLAVIVALIATAKVAPGAKTGKAEDGPLADRLLKLAKDKPLIALGAGAVAVTVLLRNPAMVSALVSAFVAGKATKPTR